MTKSKAGGEQEEKHEINKNIKGTHTGTKKLLLPIIYIYTYINIYFLCRPFSDPKTNNKDKGTYDTAFHTLSIEVSTPEGCLNSDVQKSRKEKLQNDAYLGKLKSKAEWEG